MEAELGHELNDNLFYLVNMLKEREHKNGRAEGISEGEQKKEKEMIFNMFAEGLNDEIISRCSSGYSVEDIAALRKEWLEKVSSENAN
jgi:hypothetical protein